MREGRRSRVDRLRRLIDYRQKLDDPAPVELLRPEGTQYAWFADVGWAGLNVPGLPNADSSFEGNFTGPNAAELMARFEAPFLVDGQQGTLSGAWVGKKN